MLPPKVFPKSRITNKRLKKAMLCTILTRKRAGPAAMQFIIGYALGAAGFNQKKQFFNRLSLDRPSGWA
jgi:hypothetical protein